MSAAPWNSDPRQAAPPLTPPEQAILGAARAWVAALRAVSTAEAGDVSNEQWYATSRALDAAERALCAAVDAAGEEPIK